jgi:predicted transcriptional regulator
MEESSVFEPSLRILSRILGELLDNSVTKTELSQRSRVNYTRFLKHLDWLDERRLVELSVERHKVIVRLTRRGREFALTLLGNKS